MIDLGQGILEEFAERAHGVCTVDDDFELTVFYDNPNERQRRYLARHKRERQAYLLASKDKRNAHRRMMRKLNPGYGR